MFCIGPLAQSGLDKAFGFSVGLGRVGSGAAMLNLQAAAGLTELSGAVAAAVIGEQSAHPDAMAGEELPRMVQEGDGGLGLLVGQQLGKSQPGVIVDGDMQRLEAGMFALSAQASIAAQGDLGEAGHALDVQMHKVSGGGVFVAHDGRTGVQVAPTAEAGAAQDAADRGGGEATAKSDLVAGHVLAA